MPSVNVYNLEGEVVGTRELPGAIFGLPVSPGLLQFAVAAQAANRRRAIAHTKTRGEVRGGGRKPWKQKGTGRARHGSIRSPLWIGGGVTFGPRSDRNFSLKINRKVRRRALLESLSAKASEQALVLVQDLAPVGKKSKLAEAALRKLKLRGVFARPAAPAATTGQPAPARAAWPSVLVVLPPPAPDQVLAFRNLRRVSVISADSLNVRDVLASRYLLMPLASVGRLAEVYGPKSATGSWPD